jgi:hypothetical protein
VSIESDFDSNWIAVPSGCHEWLRALSNNGYGQLWWQGKRSYAHRIAYERANGPIPAGKMVLHRCDNRKCINLEHLFLGSSRDNQRDMRAKGRGQKPWQNLSRAKLRIEDVHRIRDMLKSGASPTEISSLFPVTERSIREIRGGRKWAWV